MDLAGQFLIAMPGLADPNFHQTVTLVCEHGREGALGVVINRVAELTLGELAAQVGLKVAHPALARRDRPPRRRAGAPGRVCDRAPPARAGIPRCAWARDSA